MVSDADEKEFIGKDSVIAKDVSSHTTHTSEPIEKKVSLAPKKEKKESLKTPIKPISSNSSDDEWASF